MLTERKVAIIIRNADFTDEQPDEPIWLPATSKVHSVKRPESSERRRRTDTAPRTPLTRHHSVAGSVCRRSSLFGWGVGRGVSSGRARRHLWTDGARASRGAPASRQPAAQAFSAWKFSSCTVLAKSNLWSKVSQDLLIFPGYTWKGKIRR